MIEGAVCPGCVTGFLHDGEPKGTEGTIAKLPTYIAKPTNTPSKPGFIVVVPDAFGWRFVNNRLIADEYAEKTGRTVYLPDFMSGDAPSPEHLKWMNPVDGSKPSFYDIMFSALLSRTNLITGVFSMLWEFIPWFWNHRAAVTTPIVISFLQILRTENPDAKVGLAGFCWGGKYALIASQKKSSATPLVEAAFVGHPSFLSVPADVEKPNAPISLAVASTDIIFSPKSAEKVEKLWKEDPDYKYEMKIYDGASHGFCVRGDMRDEKQKEHMTQSCEQAVKWFDTYLQ